MLRLWRGERGELAEQRMVQPIATGIHGDFREIQMFKKEAARGMNRADLVPHASTFPEYVGFAKNGQRFLLPEYKASKIMRKHTDAVGGSEEDPVVDRSHVPDSLWVGGERWLQVNRHGEGNSHAIGFRDCMR